MKQRIAHLTDVNLDTAFFRAIAGHLDPARFEAVIGSVAGAGTLQAEMQARSVPTFALGLPLKSPRAVLRLIALLRRERIDLLHSHCFLPTLWGLLAARFSARPFVFTRHHSDHHLRLGRRGPVAIDAWCAKHADRVIAVSDATKKILVEIEHVPEPQIVVVHNGIEPLSPGNARQIAALRASLGLEDRRRVVLVPSRLHEEKGHATLFAALESVIASVGPLAVLLAGDGGYRTELSGLVERMGWSGVVRFLGRRADVADLMVLSDLVVVPSLAESFGFVALEAMSLGRPLIVSSAGGLPEVVENCGMVFPMGNSAALATAMVTMLTEPQRARALGDAGAIRARLFTAERMVRGYEAVYERLLGH